MDLIIEAGVGVGVGREEILKSPERRRKGGLRWFLDSEKEIRSRKG